MGSLSALMELCSQYLAELSLARTGVGFLPSEAEVCAIPLMTSLGYRNTEAFLDTSVPGFT